MRALFVLLSRCVYCRCYCSYCHYFLYPILSLPIYILALLVYGKCFSCGLPVLKLIKFSKCLCIFVMISTEGTSSYSRIQFEQCKKNQYVNIIRNHGLSTIHGVIMLIHSFLHNSKFYNTIHK